MEEYKIRVRIFIGVIIITLGILAIQLVRLQLIDKAESEKVALGNAIKPERVLPRRGLFYDRKGTMMVANEPAYTITLTPRYFDESKIGLLARLLEVPDSVVTARLAEARRWSSYRSSPSFRNVSLEIYSRVQENAYRLPGVGEEIDQKRRYLSQARAAHALGYLREVKPKDLQADRTYRPGDLIGEVGLERHYESYLRGKPGVAYKLVDVHGVEIDSYMNEGEDKSPEGGFDLHLTLDSDVQALAEALFVNKRGAAVALDPNTGAILALVSKPDYNPAIFSGFMDPATWDTLGSSRDAPLWDRARQNKYEPGSTWKPFVALMALEEGIIKEDTKIYCGGGLRVGSRYFKCHEVPHDSVTVKAALENSCNTFFYSIMMESDEEAFEKWWRLFGFDKEAPRDSTSQTPDRAHQKKVWSDDLRHIVELGIGQGRIQATPLQLAQYVAALANGGVLHQPYLVDSLRQSETRQIIRETPGRPDQIPINPAYLDTVRAGMRLVMEKGTGQFEQIPAITSGGKTGTVQVGGDRKDHSAFIMFAPFENPKIAIVVFVENGGDGALQAAPIASLMAEQYLNGRIIYPYRQRRIRELIEDSLLYSSQPL